MEKKPESASRESSHYAALGASSSKEGVLTALGTKAPTHFVEVSPDPDDPTEGSVLLHADGAGTKSVVAYLAYRETGDPTWFRGIAQDSLVMNLDDVAAVGCFRALLLSNTIGRNRRFVPDEVVAELINGYRASARVLDDQGVKIQLAGGETADLSDLVRTVVVDSTLSGRIKNSSLVTFAGAQIGDQIIGFSSTGRTRFESKENSGIGSNGLTLARHALIPPELWKRYPEAKDPEGAPPLGAGSFLDFDAELGMSLAEAILSPTRSYAPILKAITEEIPLSKIHGIVHCTGGGQTKIRRFLPHLRVVKNKLFSTPPLFQKIQRQGQIPWSEMYAVFNMGHRMEVVCSAELAQPIIEIARRFDVAATVVGSVEAGSPEIIIESEHGVFAYQ